MTQDGHGISELWQPVLMVLQNNDTLLECEALMRTVSVGLLYRYNSVTVGFMVYTLYLSIYGFMLDLWCFINKLKRCQKPWHWRMIRMG